LGPYPDDVTAADFSLVEAARHGDRLAFGVLYLRHHAAAWRIACVASRFSPDAELAVIEAFTRLFSALPEEAEELRTGTVTLRPYVLACARQAALDRAGAAGRADGPGAPAPAPLAGLGPDGEVVLSTLEHHVARGALAALPERSRTALWLFDVEAMTPAEVAGVLGGSPQEIAALAGSARAEVRAAQQAAFGRHEVRAGCRFTVEHLDGYRAGALEPTDGLIVRSHLDRCPPCRMRHGELADAPATLAAAVPAAPLLGGETQQHWLAAADIEPAERLLAPAAAAVAGAATGSARRLPGVLRRAGRAATRSWRTPDIDLGAGPATEAPPVPAGRPGPATPPAWTDPPWWSGSFTPPLPPAWTRPPARAATGHDAAGDPAGAAAGTGAGRRPAVVGAAAVAVDSVAAAGGRRRRAVWPAATAVSVVAAWLFGMMAVPWLMMPGVASGPDGMALPAVQAYVSGLLPDARPSGRATGAGRGPAAGAGLNLDVAGAPGSEPMTSRGDLASAEAAARSWALGRPARAAIAAATRPAGTGPTLTSVVAAVPAPALLSTPPPATTVAVVAVTTPPPARRPGRAVRTRTHGKGPGSASAAAVVPDRPAPKADPPATGRPARRHDGPRVRIVTA